ncbi:hypothetical protein AB0L70_29835 [Kribbella sp. NPDC051952]|uniref:hypothetical protein n=1 Tax=Kribbella sp. NPDC051952 TaxID=3154851 RepID=UPI00341EC0BD
MPQRADVQQLQVEDDPFAGQPEWPARWIRAAENGDVVGFRLPVECAQPAEVVVHVSADERYELWLDGDLIGRGPSRGEVGHWSFESYRLRLPAGGHWIAARVWSLGDDAPLAQQTSVTVLPSSSQQRGLNSALVRRPGRRLHCLATAADRKVTGTAAAPGTSVTAARSHGVGRPARTASTGHRPRPAAYDGWCRPVCLHQRNDGPRALASGMSPSTRPDSRPTTVS